MNPFGERDGKIVHIDELSFLERGLKCNCTCPSCGMKLQARLGNEFEGRRKRIKHFAHHNSNCSNSFESSIHKLAKEVFSNSDQVLFPELFISRRVLPGYPEPIYSCFNIIDESVKVFYTIPAGNYYYTNVRVESRLGSIIPDIILNEGETEVLIEIAVTHFVDDKKNQKISDIKKSAIEIDLEYLKTSSVFDRQRFDYMLLDTVLNKKWLYCLSAENIICEDKKRFRLERERVKAEKKTREKERREKIKSRVARENERKELKRVAELSKLTKQENFEKRRRKFTERMEYDPLWIEVSNKLSIACVSDVPDVFKKEFIEDWLFDCAPPIWKLMLYHDLIEGKQGEYLSYWQVVNWIKNHPSMRFHSIMFTNKMSSNNANLNRVISAVIAFLDYLTIECRILYRKYPYQRFNPNYEIKSSSFKELMSKSVYEIHQSMINENSKNLTTIYDMLTEKDSKESADTSDDAAINNNILKRDNNSNGKLYNFKGYHFSELESEGKVFLSNLFFETAGRTNIDIFKVLKETHTDVKFDIIGYHDDCIVFKVKSTMYKIVRHHGDRVITFDQFSSKDTVYTPIKHATEFKNIIQLLKQQEEWLDSE
jgi:hypothetical protein